MTRLTPYGLFAIAANAAGTLSVEQLSRLQIYLVAYVAVALLVSLWVLPGLVAALTPIRARDILGESRDSLITAFIAGDLFIVLPGLMQASRTLLDRLDPGDGEPGQLTDVIVPASFNFPHTGKLLSLSFVLFAGWFADALVPLSAYPQLALAGLVSFFGSLNAAVPFLLDQFRIPADTFQLFLATGVINSRVGSLVAAVHTLTVALLVACAVTGRLRWRRGPILSYAGRHGRPRRSWSSAARACSLPPACPSEYSKDKVLASMQLLQRTGRRHRGPHAVPGTRHEPAAARDHRRAQGAARRVPARRAAVRLLQSSAETWWASTSSSRTAWRARWVSASPSCPSIATRLAEQLADGYCDLVMSGVAVTTDRAREMLFSDSYLDETLAFVVPDDQREQYASWDAIRDRGALTIAVPDVPYYVRKLRDAAAACRHRGARSDIEPLFDRSGHPRRCAGAAGRARVGMDPDVSGVLGRRAGPRSDPRAARVSDRQTRRSAWRAS